MSTRATPINLSNLMRVLRRGIWHRTSVEALAAIVEAGAIRANDGSFPTTYPQSHNSYGRKIGAVSLFDFASASPDQIKETKDRWRKFLHDQHPLTILIRINRELIADRLVPNETGRQDIRVVWIPYVEAWCRGEVPIAAFQRYVIVSTIFPRGYVILRPHPKVLDEILNLAIEALEIENSEIREHARTIG